MKKPHVLNRPMFNKGGTSAYGKGITSNLVSDEQRQRFNYGGRVGFAPENEMRYIPWRDAWSEWAKPGLQSVADIFKSGVHPFYGDVLGQDVQGEDVIYEDPLAEAKFKRGREDIVEKQVQEMKESSPGHPSQFEEVEELKKSQIPRPGIEPGTLPTDRESDVIDWTEFAEGLYDKKGAKGKALLGLAGNVLAASQQPKKEAAAILGKGMGEFGKTWTERKEKIEDIAATGKMYEKVNVAKAAEAGKWAVAAEKIKQGILNSDTAIYNKAALKNNKPKEGLEAVVKFDILAAPTKEGVLDEEAFKAKGEGSVGQYQGQFVILIEGGEIRRGDAEDIKDEYSAWKARKKLANSPTS